MGFQLVLVGTQLIIWLTCFLMIRGQKPNLRLWHILNLGFVMLLLLPGHLTTYYLSLFFGGLFITTWLFVKVLSKMDRDKGGASHWILGGIYYDPKDSKVFVPKRSGLGMTVNTGTLAGKIFTIFTAGLTLAVVAGVLYISAMDDFVPHKVVLGESEAVFSSHLYHENLPYGDVAKVSLLTQVDLKYKTNGVSTDQYARGYFEVAGLGKCAVFLFKNEGPIILIERRTGLPILYSAQTKEETLKVFEALKGHSFGSLDRKLIGEYPDGFVPSLSVLAAG